MEANYIGIKWVHQGRNPVSGFDCIGFILLCSWYLGENTKNFTGYGEEPKSSLLIPETEKRAVSIPLNQSLPGDFFIMWTNPKTRRPRHYGMLGYNHTLYHSNRSLGGLCREDLGGWGHKIHSAWRFKSIWQLSD